MSLFPRSTSVGAYILGGLERSLGPSVSANKTALYIKCFNHLGSWSCQRDTKVKIKRCCGACRPTDRSVQQGRQPRHWFGYRRSPEMFLHQGANPRTKVTPFEAWYIGILRWVGRGPLSFELMCVSFGKGRFGFLAGTEAPLSSIWCMVCVTMRFSGSVRADTLSFKSVTNVRTCSSPCVRGSSPGEP